MYTYKCLNPIAGIGLKNFTANYEKVNEDEKANIILVRSAKMHDMEFDDDLYAIARAGAGVNNIPLDKCAEQGIVVFNTPGANANGVKELFVFAAIAGVRDIIGGIEWVQKEYANPEIAELTEKEKKKFVGHEIMGKTLGIIGLGAIGVKVANIAVELGMKVIGYDPYLPDASKANLNSVVEIVENIDDLTSRAEMITIHVPANAKTVGMVDAGLLSRCRDGVIFINLARDTLVNTDDMNAALNLGKVSKYICDFPTFDTCKMKNTIFIPHLGASTEESEDNCAIMAVQEVVDFMENGNIKNSVNFPTVDMGRAPEGIRICVTHKSSVKASDIVNKLTSMGSSVRGMATKEKGDYAYSIFDITTCLAQPEGQLNMDGVLKVRVIKK